MTRPLVIDGCCGEGGAAQGYHLAGYDVLGCDTDTARLARYPFESVLMDVVEFILAYGPDADLIHVSPPCTGYTQATSAIPDRVARYTRLIPAVREACLGTGRPYIIENVTSRVTRSELIDPLMLCWTEFNTPGSVTDEDGTPLWMRRHRLFESNLPLMGAGGCQHPGRDMQCAGAYGGARRDKWEARHVRRGGYVPAADVARRLVGTPWMSEKGCHLSIPPAYTRFLGEQAWLLLNPRTDDLTVSCPGHTEPAPTIGDPATT